MHIVGIAGRKGHGKDTAAEVLETLGFRVMRFADPLKAMLRAFYREAGVWPGDISRRLEGDLKEAPCYHLSGATPRHAMQLLGTEWRDALAPPHSTRLWSRILYDRVVHMDPETRPHGIVIPDVRFPHEVETVRSLKGGVLRVKRPGLYLQDLDAHQSEKLVDDLDVDFDLMNRGTREAFQEDVLAWALAQRLNE